MAKSKGYQPGKRANRPEARIAFAEGDEFHGAEIRCWLTAPFGLYLELAALEDVSGAEALARAADTLRKFADTCLVEWNLEDDAGAPYPANGAGFMAQEPQLVKSIISAWVEVVGQPGSPLVVASNGSNTSVAE